MSEPSQLPVERAALHLLDWLACAIKGRRAPLADKLAAFMREARARAMTAVSCSMIARIAVAVCRMLRAMGPRARARLVSGVGWGLSVVVSCPCPPVSAAGGVRGVRRVAPPACTAISGASCGTP